MSTADHLQMRGANETSELDSPFAEAGSADSANETVGFTAWNRTASPFTEAVSPFAEADEVPGESEGARLISEVLTELREDSFHEALASLAEETEQAVSERFPGEIAAHGDERERFAHTRLADLRFEAERYVDTLAGGLSGLDLASLNEAQLESVLDRHDPEPGGLTPAGEEFLGSWVKKAKSALKLAVRTAGAVSKIAAPFVGPLLGRLRALVKPLLQRVLSFAIGRLPAPLQPVARQLAARLTARFGQEQYDEMTVSPAAPGDTRSLAEEFDLVLAETIIGGVDEAPWAEEEAGSDGRALETLAAARGALIDRLAQSENAADLAPAFEQFIPALLAALRVGVNLIGRPKVVSFLAKYLASFLGRWVAPTVAAPLSNAIVDTGLRLVSLEAEDTRANAEAAPVALAAVVEDTARRLSESEDYVLDNAELMQLAVSESFGQAIASHFPPHLVRQDLQQAPSLGGIFVVRRPRHVRSYRKYSRTPDIEITSQIADTLPAFGGQTLSEAMRALGAALPQRARMHVYEAVAGSTLSAMARHDRSAGQGGHLAGSTHFQPLTPAAAATLLREPRLGHRVPDGYLHSRHHIAAGQRFYVLQPLGAAAPLAQGSASRSGGDRAWIAVNRHKGRIVVGIHLSEATTQSLAEAVRAGHGHAALLQALVAAYRRMEQARSMPHLAHEEGESFEQFAGGAAVAAGGVIAQLRARIGALVLPALASWIRDNAAAVIRASGSTGAGVTVRARLSGLTGLGHAAGVLRALRTMPAILISASPGLREVRPVKPPQAARA